MIDDHKKKNVEFYNNTAMKYDSSHAFNRENRNQLKKISKIIDLINVKDGDMVLEVGCGTGIHAKALLSKKRVKYVALDMSSGMIGETRKRLMGNEDLFLTIADAEKLPFSDEMFDGVYCSGSLHHMTCPHKVFKEMCRVLKKGKMMVLMEPNKYCIKNYLEAKFVAVEKNILAMKMSNFRKWAQENKMEVQDLSYFIYTPPVPQFMVGFYDKVDELMRKAPLLKFTSVMLYFAATRGVSDDKQA